MNKKAQFDNPLILFAVLIVGLLVIAPVVLKIFNSVQAPVSNSLGNLSAGGAVAQTNFNAVINTGINFWDKVMVAAFFFAVLLLVVSAFLIDAHPFFIILYILMNVFLIMFAPSIVAAIDVIYESATFATEVSALTFMDTIRTYYAEFLVGMMVLTGIIIYGKIALFGGNKR